MRVAAREYYRGTRPFFSFGKPVPKHNLSSIELLPLCYTRVKNNRNIGRLGIFFIFAVPMRTYAFPRQPDLPRNSPPSR